MYRIGRWVKAQEVFDQLLVCWKNMVTRNSVEVCNARFLILQQCCSFSLILPPFFVGILKNKIPGAVFTDYLSRLSFGFLWLWSLRFEFFRTSPLKCKSKRNFYTSTTVPSAIIKSGIVSQMIHYDQHNAKVIIKICYFFFLIRFTAKIDYHYFMSSQILDFMCSKTVIEERCVNFLLILSKYQRRI